MSATNRKNVAKIQTKYADQYEDAVMYLAKKRKLLIRRLAAFFILASVIFYFVVSAMIAQSATLDKKIATKEALQEELMQLEKEKTTLEEEIVKLNDDEYLAKLARRDYFLSGENEIIFNLPKKKKDKLNNNS